MESVVLLPRCLGVIVGRAAAPLVEHREARVAAAAGGFDGMADVHHVAASGRISDLLPVIGRVRVFLVAWNDREHGGDALDRRLWIFARFPRPARSYVVGLGK